MKTFHECCDEVATNWGYMSFSNMLECNPSEYGNHVPQAFYIEVSSLYAKEYALSCIEASLIKAAENAEIVQCDTEYNYQTGRRDPVYDVDRESITEPENRVLL